MDKNDKVLTNKVIKFTVFSPKWLKPVTYSFKANSLGFARILINLYPGDYNMVTEFPGDTVYNKSTAFNKIKVIR